MNEFSDKAKLDSVCLVDIISLCKWNKKTHLILRGIQNTFDLPVQTHKPSQPY